MICLDTYRKEGINSADRYGCGTHRERAGRRAEALLKSHHQTTGRCHQRPTIACWLWVSAGQNGSPCPKGHQISKADTTHTKKITQRRAQSPRLLEVVSSARAWSCSHPLHQAGSLRIQGEPEEGQVYQNQILASYTPLFINLDLLKKKQNKTPQSLCLLVTNHKSTDFPLGHTSAHVLHL